MSGSLNILLKVSKLYDFAINCKILQFCIEKNYFKIKFFRRKQSFKCFLLKTVPKILVKALKNNCA